MALGDVAVGEKVLKCAACHSIVKGGKITSVLHYIMLLEERRIYK